MITALPSSRDEWVMETQAGVCFWTHQDTGEIRTECPYDQTRPSTANIDFLKEKRLGGREAALEAEDEEEATGALVYDRSEYQEYLLMLGDNIVQEDVNH